MTAKTGARVAMLATAIALTGSALTSRAQSASQAAPSRVAIHVFILARTGLTPIADAKPEDFRLTVDGTPVGGFALDADPRPLSTIVLLDTSYSEREFISWAQSKPETAISATIDALVSSAAPGDTFRVGGIAAKAALGSAFTTDAAALKDQARRAYDVPASDIFGPSPIWDAIYDASDAFAAQPGRRTVLVISDGYASGDHHFRDETIEHASVNDVAVFSVQRPSIEHTGLEDAATLTGGLIVQDNVPLRAQVLPALYRIMRSGYQLTFDAPFTDDRAHRVDLRTSVPTETVVMRRYVKR